MLMQLLTNGRMNTATDSFNPFSVLFKHTGAHCHFIIRKMHFQF